MNTSILEATLLSNRNNLKTPMKFYQKNCLWSKKVPSENHCWQIQKYTKTHCCQSQPYAKTHCWQIQPNSKTPVSTDNFKHFLFKPPCKNNFCVKNKNLDMLPNSPLGVSICCPIAHWGSAYAAQ